MIRHPNGFPSSNNPGVSPGGQGSIGEESLTASNRRLNQIIEFLPDATFVIDEKGTIVAWNRAMERMTSLGKERMLGRGSQEYSIPFYGHRRPMLADLCLCWDEATLPHYDYVQHEDDILYGECNAPSLYSGRGAAIWGSARPLYDESGHITGAIETLRDITGRRTAEKAAIDWKRRYELIAAASGQITYEHNTENGDILWSKASEIVLGFQISNVATWQACIHPEDLSGVNEQLAKAISEGSPFDVEYRMCHRNGEYLWFHDRAYPTTNAANNRCLIGMIVDITASRRAEEALRLAHDKLEQRVRERTEQLARSNALLHLEIEEKEQTRRALESSEKKYRTMLDSLPQVVFEIDLAGNILLLNRQGYTVAGITPEDLNKGLSITDFLEEEDRGRLVENFTRLISGGNVTGNEYTFVGKSGIAFPATVYARIITRDKHPIGVTGFLIDESPRHQARKTLQKAHDELEERVATRTSELAASNASLITLLRKQEMNIQLAHKVLLLVNSDPPRHVPLRDGSSLFVAARLMPRHLEGGDHFLVRNSLTGPRPHTFISLKDQSGHEVGCILRSIITDLIHNALLSAAAPDPSLETVATQLNRELCNSHLFEDGEFFTSVDLQLDHENLTLHYLIAGHPPFILVRNGQASLIPGEDRVGSNLPIGIIANHRFTAGSVVLRPGDRLLLYTDGLLDSACLAGTAPLSSSDLPRLVQESLEEAPGLSATALARRLYKRISDRFLSGETPERLPDDLAILALEVEVKSASCEDTFHAANITELGEHRRRLLAKILEEWSDHGIDASHARLQMVMEEALYNAWKHGSASAPEKPITVRRSYGNDALIEVIDQGPGFDWAAVGDPTAYENRLRPSGRGLYMIRRFSDEALWSDQGRHLSIYFSGSPAFTPQDKVSPLHRFSLWAAPTNSQIT